jgi:tripartite-type tricarboxylate transporter receptor subunit TctC
VIGDLGSLVIGPLAKPGLGYDPQKDFAPVSVVSAVSIVVTAHPKSGINSIADLLARARAQPGKLNYASSGPGTPYHMAGELFKSMAKIDIVHIPYKGSSGARTDVLGGQVEMMFDAVTTMNEYAKAGKVRPLATTGKARSMVLPNVPTMAAAGVAGYEAVIWLGVMAPKATPAPIVGRLNAEIQKIVARHDVRNEWAKQGAVGMFMTPEEFSRYVADDSVDLIYLDPPFNSAQDYNAFFHEKDGTDAASQTIPIRPAQNPTRPWWPDPR